MDAVSQFVQECHDGTYPGPEHCYKMKAGEEEKLKELLKEQGLSIIHPRAVCQRIRP